MTDFFILTFFIDLFDIINYLTDIYPFLINNHKSNINYCFFSVLSVKQKNTEDQKSDRKSKKYAETEISDSDEYKYTKNTQRDIIYLSAWYIY